MVATWALDGAAAAPPIANDWAGAAARWARATLAFLAGLLFFAAGDDEGGENSSETENEDANEDANEDVDQSSEDDGGSSDDGDDGEGSDDEDESDADDKGADDKDETGDESDESEDAGAADQTGSLCKVTFGNGTVVEGIPYEKAVALVQAGADGRVVDGDGKAAEELPEYRHFGEADLDEEVAYESALRDVVREWNDATEDNLDPTKPEEWGLQDRMAIEGAADRRARGKVQGNKTAKAVQDAAYAKAQEQQNKAARDLWAHLEGVVKESPLKDLARLDGDGAFLVGDCINDAIHQVAREEEHDYGKAVQGAIQKRVRFFTNSKTIEGLKKTTTQQRPVTGAGRQSPRRVKRGIPPLDSEEHANQMAAQMAEMIRNRARGGG